MILQKNLTIREIFNEMKLLKIRLIKLYEKYKISNIPINAVTWKDIVVVGSKKGDIMLNKEIKKELMNDEIEIVKESYRDYRNLAIEKIKEMIATKTTEECITYFRDELKWKWDDIAKVFDYSVRQCQRLYYKTINMQDVAQCPIKK